MLPLVPVLCIAAAITIRHVALWAVPRFRISHAVALGGLLSVVIIPALVNTIWFDVLLARTDSRVLAARWLASNVQPQDTLYDDGGMYVVLDLSRTQFHAWSFDRADNSFGGAEGQTPDWLILYRLAGQLLRKRATRVT